jgi:hypothetical protein
MRAIDKGTAPKVYSKYGDAKPDLIHKCGCYCAYCEMPVLNAPQLEHVIPQNHAPHLELVWDNFLLSCFPCNLIKRNNNTSRNGYLWADIDNTDLAFDYNQSYIIRVKSNLPQNITDAANALIDLTGLNRKAQTATPMDFRWKYSDEAWEKAKAMLIAWNTNSSTELAEAISEIAHSTGFYSIWKTVFQGIQVVINKIEQRFIGTYNQVDINNNRVIRPNGLI